MIMRTFWDKQPVPQEGIKYENGQEIDKEREVATESQKLPNGFSWKVCSVEEAHPLLNEQYISSDSSKIKYSLETLKWAAESPGYENRGIIRDETQELIGFISSVPNKIRVCEDILSMVQINFMCVHDDFRTMGFAPILISEMKRIANTKGIWQAVFTAVTKIPTPIVKSRYWHRILNVKKLSDIGFYKVTNKTKQKYLEVHGTSQFRKMHKGDIPKVTNILQNHFKKFKVAPVIDKEWVKHWILPANSYINDSDDTFISFYDIPNERKDGTSTIYQVYSFYIVGDVYNDAFLIAKNLGYDMFTTLDIGQSIPNLEKQKFLLGSSSIHYYLFNWLPSSTISLEDVQVKLP
jgi:glycylpeptide N-tetradecanoyltransferase